MATTEFKQRVIFVVVFILLSIWAYRSLLAEQEANTQLATFNSTYEPGSDGYCIDSIMYNHPSWTFDQAEDYLFGGDYK